MTTSQNTDIDSWELVTDAAALAAKAHEGQARHDGTPYIQHPARVAVLLAQAGAGEAMIAAGFLHDVIEDCTVDWDEIEDVCNGDVANWVAAMTKDMRMPEDSREAAYQQQLVDGPWQGRAIKLADQIDNFTNASESTRHKVKPRAKWAIDIATGDDAPVSVRLRERLSAVLSSDQALNTACDAKHMNTP